MARVNIYLPDELAKRARESQLNISAIARSALEEQLTRSMTNAWLDRVLERPRGGLAHEDVIEQLDAVRDEMGDFADER